jgi:predicted ester cyclase
VFDKSPNYLASGLLAAVMAAATMIPARATDLKIDEMTVATTIPAAQAKTITETAQQFYEFWNTGDTRLLKRVISPAFVDHTLPPGRPQGPTGPAFASKQFRAAVPDLRVEVINMVVADGYVTVHMVFTGHFTGIFAKANGAGQSIRFIATDLLKVENGQITDNWHIEDNLTLLEQMGIFKFGS